MSWRDFGQCGCGCVTTSVNTMTANDVTKEAGLFMMRLEWFCSRVRRKWLPGPLREAELSGGGDRVWPRCLLWLRQPLHADVQVMDNQMDVSKSTKTSLYWTGSEWTGLVWTQLAQTCLKYTGLDQTGLN